MPGTAPNKIVYERAAPVLGEINVPKALPLKLVLPSELVPVMEGMHPAGELERASSRGPPAAVKCIVCGVSANVQVLAFCGTGMLLATTPFTTTLTSARRGAVVVLACIVNPTETCCKVLVPGRTPAVVPLKDSQVALE
jgi:hypothetical protein